MAARIRVPAVVVARPDWSALRTELHIDEAMPAEVEAAAQAAAAAIDLRDRIDCSSDAFFTLDPPASKDLDQAMFLARNDVGYLVRYAIADVSAFVKPGDALDRRSHLQGETFYGPDRNVLLYPATLSEGAASLLPGQVRPAVLWTLHLDGTGELVNTMVERAVVQSHRQLAYDEAEAMRDDEQLELLREIGQLRQALARERDAVDLPTPEQLVDDGVDGPVITYRAPSSFEAWNSQISLLTGMAAAALMVQARVGLLRTLPEADPQAVASLRLTAKALGVEWPQDASYGDVVSGLDPKDGNAAAFLNVAVHLLRGAGYTAFQGELPAVITHAGVGAPYAHCTAPLRRLGDRYVNEICLALAARRAVPQWALDALPQLPEELAASGRKAHGLDRAVVDAAEAFVMQNRMGEMFSAVAVDKQTVQLQEPAVRGRIVGAEMQPGSVVRVRCFEADLLKRSVKFELVR